MHRFFAAANIEINPDITNGFALIFALLIVGAIGAGVWVSSPRIYKYLKKKRTDALITSNNIWFDSEEPALHRGKYSVRIEPKSLHYFLCRFTFSNPEKYYKDGDILDEKDHVNENRRSMYHSVRNLNKKVKDELKLEQDLFVYSNNSTAISKYYRNKLTKR